MISMIRVAKNLCIAVVAAVTALLPTGPSYAGAGGVAYVSTTGVNSNSCGSASQPCATISQALRNLSNSGRVVCLSPPGTVEAVTGGPTTLAQIDCPQGVDVLYDFEGVNMTVSIRNLTFKTDSGFASGIIVFNSSGSLILDNCIFDSIGSTPPLSIEPSGPFNLVIKNSRISNSLSGITLKPLAGGSIYATLDHVTIADNTGGGLKIDTTNGPVTADISDSVISNNGGNGINAVGGAGGQAMVSIKNSVIAKNAVAGVQANGANAGIMIATTLFDQNATGALSIVSGGNILTYGNNQVVGAQGSNFTGTASLR